MRGRRGAAQQLVRLAERAAAGQRNPWRLNALGAALYRVGRHKQAIAALNDSLAEDANWNKAWNYAYLAMAHHRLGQGELARQELQEAGQALNRMIQRWFTSDLGRLPALWWHVLESQLHYREAKELIDGSAPHEDARLWVIRGRALAAVKREREAADCQARAVQLSPDDLQIRVALLAPEPNPERLAAALAVLATFLQEHSEQTSEAKRALAQKYCELAWQLRNDKRYQNAVDAYSQAVNVAPDYAPAWHERGRVRYDLLKQYDLAQHDWSKVIELEPKNAVATFGLGNALRVQNKLDDAISVYRKAIALDSKNAQAHNNLGLVLRAQHKLDDAIAEYRQAIVLDPKYTLAYSNLGAALFAQKKLAEAIAAYRQAIAVDPNYAQAHSNLGVALRAQGKLEEGIAEYRKAIALDPRLAQARYNLGRALQVQGKLNEAIAEYRQAIALDPKYSLPHNNLGNVLLAQRKFAEAIAEYRLAIALDPKNAEAHNNLAWVLATSPQDNLRDAGQAVELAQRAVALAPAEGICWRTLGVANYRAGHWQAALQALDKSIALRRGGNSTDWFFLAMAHWQLGEKDKARPWYDRAVQWMEKNQPTDEELRSFRAETEQVLGIGK